MRTPEEIKNGIRKCWGFGADCEDVCDTCPYWSEGKLCRGALCRDAIAYIEQMEKNSSLNTMRDAEIVTRCKDCVQSAPLEGYASRKFEIGLNCRACIGDIGYGIVDLSFTVPDGYCDDGLRRAGEAHD